MAYSEEFKTAFKAKFLEFLEANGGNIRASLEGMNKGAPNRVRRSTLYNWMETDADFKEEIREITEGWLDNVESALTKTALEGNVTAQIFLLKTRGKDRGYIESKAITKRKIKVTIKDDKPPS